MWGDLVPVAVAEAEGLVAFAPVGWEALAEPVVLEELFPQGLAEAVSPLCWLRLVQRAHLVVRFVLMNSSVRSGMEMLWGSECSGSACGSRGWCRYEASSASSGGAHSRLSSGRESSS